MTERQEVTIRANLEDAALLACIEVDQRGRREGWRVRASVLLMEIRDAIREQVPKPKRWTVEQARGVTGSTFWALYDAGKASYVGSYVREAVEVIADALNAAERP